MQDLEKALSKRDVISVKGRATQVRLWRGEGLGRVAGVTTALSSVVRGGRRR